MAVDRSTGARRGWIYIVYPERSPSAPDIFLIRSTDNGSTWTDPVTVNQDHSGKDQWHPWITVDPATGNLFVVYYDSRNFPANDSAEVYISASTDGGETFEDFLVSDVPFLPRGVGNVDPVPSNYIGSYIGISALQGVIWPCWNDNRTGAHQVYTSRIIFSPILGVRTSASQVEITWTDAGVVLQESTDLKTWTDVSAATSPYQPTIGQRPHVFYRLRN